MLAALSPTHTFVLGTRYGKGVEMDKDWPVHRRIISAGARILALPLTSASDPMSGFFGIRKEAVSISSSWTLLRIAEPPEVPQSKELELTGLQDRP